MVLLFVFEVLFLLFFLFLFPFFLEGFDAAVVGPVGSPKTKHPD